MSVFLKVKKHNGMSGNGRKKFTWFEEMDRILGPRPASQPHYLVQSGREDHQAYMQSIEEGEESEKENLEGILVNIKMQNFYSIY